MDLSESLKEIIGDRNLCAYTEQELSDGLRGRNMAKYESYNGENKNRAFGLREVRHNNQGRGRLKLEWERDYG